MGANAQTSVPSFADGQVLTGQQQTEINTGIPVFATSVERDAAFGGTGEKVLAEGQFAFLEDTNATQFYDGSTWQAVGVNPGLVCVKAETAFSAVASVTADNVFTSAYSNYKILFACTNSSAGALRFKLRASGTSATNNYNFRYQYSDASGVVTGAETSAASGLIGGEISVVGANVEATFFNPQLAQPTTYFATNYISRGSATTPVMYIQGGNHTLSTAYDGIEMFASAGTMTGTYAIYGYLKTV